MSVKLYRDWGHSVTKNGKALGRVRQQLGLHVDISFIFLAPFTCRTRASNNWEEKSDPYLINLNVKRKPSSGDL